MKRQMPRTKKVKAASLASINVTDGTFNDGISIKYDGSKAQVIKETGDRYNLIGNAIRNMTIEETGGQMLMHCFRTINGSDVTAMLPEIAAYIKDYHLGGIMLDGVNMVTTGQIVMLANGYHQRAEKYGACIGCQYKPG